MKTNSQKERGIVEKVKPTIIKPEGMTFEELIVAYEKKCSMWNELKESIKEDVVNFGSSITDYAEEILGAMEQLEKENE